MPKGKLKANQSQLAKLPKNASLFPPTVFPLELQTLIADLSSIINLANAARTNRAANQFYLFRCSEAKKRGDDLAAAQMLYKLEQFAYFLSDSLRKNSVKLLISAKFNIFFAKLADAYLMARDRKLQSKIANLYFDTLRDNDIPYTISDDIQVNFLVEHLKFKIQTIDVIAYLMDRPTDRRIVTLERFKLLMGKVSSDKCKCLIAKEILNALNLFKREKLEFSDEKDKQEYETAIAEHEGQTNAFLNQYNKDKGCVIS